MMQPQLDFSGLAPDTSLADAAAWRDSNPQAYAMIVAWAHEDADLRGYCAMQAYLEALRSPALSRRLGLQRSDAVYKCNNNLRSSLTRLLLSEYPALPFHPRRSMCDGPGLVNAL